MTVDDKQGRRDKLRELLARRQQAGGAPGERPLLRQLLQNPNVRRMLINWLSRGPGQGAAHPGGQAAHGDASWALDFGLDKLSREDLTTSSTPEEIQRYHTQLQNRAAWLEAALEETLVELERVEQFRQQAAEAKPTDTPEEHR